MPLSNVSELMLRDEVVEAIAAKKFHIYPVKTVEEALEIFTGVIAGKRQKKGGWTKGSIHDRADQRLAEFYCGVRGIVEKEQVTVIEHHKPEPGKRIRKDRNGGPPPKDPRDQQKPAKSTRRRSKV
jgi:hypothetical protein